MANGRLSRHVAVTNGIRQGCPFALLLFIIAADILYNEVEADSRLDGIIFKEHDQQIRLQIAGYAKDTAIYLKNKDIQQATIDAVAPFTRVSELRVNVKKSAATALCKQSGKRDKI